MSLKRGDNNALLFSKASIEVLVKARDLTGQGVRPAAIKRLISTRSKSKPSAMVNVDEDHFSDQTSEVYPPAGQLDQFNHINHDQVMSIQEVKHQFEVKLSKIEVGFIEKLTEVLQQNETLKAQSLEREQKIIAENNHLKDEILLLKEYRAADQSQASKLVQKIWESEKAITEIKEGQSFWATIKRWIGLS